METKYRGYLMKISGAVVNGKFFQSYKSTPNRQTDLDPWTDTMGYTHRNVLPHKRTTITFTTPPLCLEDKIELQSFFPDRTSIKIEYWNDEINDYSEGEFYAPDIDFEVLMPYEKTIWYRPITLELIEY